MATWRLTHHSQVPQDAGLVLGHVDGLIQWFDMTPDPEPPDIPNGENGENGQTEPE